MRAFLTASLLLPLGILPSCASCPPQAEARILRPSFDTPEDAGLSFFAALSCDDAVSEYRCLSESLKQQHGAALDAWIFARTEIRAEVGMALGQAHRLTLLEQTEHTEGILATWGLKQDALVGLIMHPQHYFDIYVKDGTRIGSFLENRPDSLLEIDGRRLRLEFSDSLLRGFQDNQSIQKLVVGTEWKVGGVVEIND